MLDTIASAIEDIKNGKLVIVVDDEDRENEGHRSAALCIDGGTPCPPTVHCTERSDLPGRWSIVPVLR